MWQGAGGTMVDTGNFKYEGNVLTMTPSHYYEEGEGGYSVSKETGSWSLRNNVLTLTTARTYLSYKSLGYNQDTGENEYIYYEVNPETLEAAQWESHSVEWETTLCIFAKDGKLSLSGMGSFARK